MATRFWCKLIVLSICARRGGFGMNLTDLQELVIVSRDNEKITTEVTSLATTEASYRHSRWHRHEREGYQSRMSHDDYQDEVADHHDEHAGDSKAVSQGKYDYWGGYGGYYDFLINEGSYKFWAAFQLATAALLIYSGFAALYYAKVNPQITEDYDDFLLRRRRREVDRDRPPRDRPFFGLEAQTLQRILDAIANQIR
ncbi:uncharacterized protein LOC100679164 [Nasonia vitripennis]|uniref:Uncharacterized protein n=1 Tax=Nasonia vitripennis TaxID=7425 RepID=A0A7M7GE68_NASVI|nr:uncharacterized protein LOC100679164 [Nasonia vitripennis]